MRRERKRRIMKISTMKGYKEGEKEEEEEINEDKEEEEKGEEEMNGE